MQNKDTKIFDKILKENLEELFLPIAEKWLGFKILEADPLPEKLQVTLEREPDFVRIVKTNQPAQFILHLEFQSTNDSEMLYRQAEYKAILQRKYQLPVRQFVIYLGSQPVKMQTQLPKEQQITGFELYNVLDYPYENLLLSEIPQEIILAILGDFHGEAPQEVIQKILGRLQEVISGNLKLQKFVRQLNMLSGLRKLQDETIKITEGMPVEFDFDIEKDILYKRGRQEGVEQGIEQGVEQGIEQEKVRATIKMLKDDFLTLEQIAKYQDISVEEVLQIKADWDWEQEESEASDMPSSQNEAESAP
jgi:predicted transposase/invertase (TIGR01784 family)